MKLSKPTSSYKSKPPHVRLAEKLIANNEILETFEGKHVWGQKIEYIITDSKNKNEAILLRDFNGIWDRKYYWDVQVYAPLMRILKTVWPESNWEEHSIIMFEKIQRTKEREEKKKEKEVLKKEKEETKKKKALKREQLKLI
jgi:DNA polymerase elongation subunit (family B)